MVAVADERRRIIRIAIEQIRTYVRMGVSTVLAPKRRIINRVTHAVVRLHVTCECF